MKIAFLALTLSLFSINLDGQTPEAQSAPAGGDRVTLTHWVTFKARGTFLTQKCDLEPVEIHRYLFKGKAGDRVGMSMKTTGYPVLTLSGPDGARLAANVNSWAGELPATGEYRIDVTSARRGGTRRAKVSYALAMQSSAGASDGGSPEADQVELIREVRFKVGSAHPEGLIRPGAVHHYRFTAKAGQVFEAYIKASGRLNFTIYPPAEASALTNASRVDHWRGRLPATGRYTVALHAEGGDAARPARDAFFYLSLHLR